MSRGKFETEKLIENMKSQLERLVQQLADLEECKDDLDEAEYEETKQDTLDQLQEFNNTMSRMMSGDMTLIDHLGSVQLATQAAISAAFHTPEVIRMFARKEPGQLRERMVEVEEGLKLGKLSQEASIRQKMEILSALRQLGEKLSVVELQYLEQHSDDFTAASQQFIKLTDTTDSGERALTMAKSEASRMYNA
ncbi:protein LZIC-like [Bacillus rossius redtenbacheri]|uniref:protein LZIC-like n=1 Tax=Bacillus rossius redtenbacheri TaxID=93214 RepID=UPI002FDF01AB